MTDNQFTTQDKIKYLKRYVLLDQEINRKFQEVERWRLRLGKITATITDMPQGGGSVWKSTDHDILNRIIDLEAAMDAEVDRLLDLKLEIEGVINGVQDDRARLLLQYKYLDGRTLEWIAGEMYYSWRWVKKLHIRAIMLVDLKCRRKAEEPANIG